MAFPHAFRVGLLFGLVALAVSTGAAAETANADWDGGYDQKAERRSDLVISSFGGLALGSGLGYPNEIDKIDEAEFESDTGLGFGSGGGLWIGIAFNDYLTFGIGTVGFGLKGGDLEASGGGLIFHVESFPLFGAGKGFQDLGLFADFGAGGASVMGADTPADGGLMSIIGAGAFYEPLRLWRFAFGPGVSYTRMWSPSLTFEGVLVGGRVSFYGGP
jgi:hypothetical protein